MPAAPVRFLDPDRGCPRVVRCGRHGWPDSARLARFRGCGGDDREGADRTAPSASGSGIPAARARMAANGMAHPSRARVESWAPMRAVRCPISARAAPGSTLRTTGRAIADAIAMCRSSSKARARNRSTPWGSGGPRVPARPTRRGPRGSHESRARCLLPPPPALHRASARGGPSPPLAMGQRGVHLRPRRSGAFHRGVSSVDTVHQPSPLAPPASVLGSRPPSRRSPALRLPTCAHPSDTDVRHRRWTSQTDTDVS